MTVNFRQSKVRRIDNSDPKFFIRDDIVIVQRAGFEISKSCPAEYKSILITAINAGWIKPVAHVHERELMIMGLHNG
jgi:hypothetical protein